MSDSRIRDAANALDAFSIRLGVFLRRYPIARLFIILYMVRCAVDVLYFVRASRPALLGSLFWKATFLPLSYTSTHNTNRLPSQVMLHVWVMVVLLTYQPEIHNVDHSSSNFHPQHPDKVGMP